MPSCGRRRRWYAHPLGRQALVPLSSRKVRHRPRDRRREFSLPSRPGSLRVLVLGLLAGKGLETILQAAELAASRRGAAPTTFEQRRARAQVADATLRPRAAREVPGSRAEPCAREQHACRRTDKVVYEARYVPASRAEPRVRRSAAGRARFARRRGRPCTALRPRRASPADLARHRRPVGALVEHRRQLIAVSTR